MHCNDRLVWGPISPSYFLLLPSISLEWNSLPWLVALLWIDLGHTVLLSLRNSAISLQILQGFYWGNHSPKIFSCSFRHCCHKGLKSSVWTAGWSVRTTEEQCFHMCLWMQLYGPKETSWTYFLGKCYMCNPSAFRKEGWISLQGCKMVLSEPRVHRRWMQDTRPTSFRAGATSYFFVVCLQCRHDTARTWMGKGAWG